jgi:ATP-dependent Zn protease
MSWSLESTAFHEAGHVVVALHFGFAVKSVTVIPDDDTVGKMEHPSFIAYDFDDRRDQHQAMREGIVSLLAGYQAELLVDPSAEDWHAGADEQAAWELMLQYPVRRAAYVGDETYARYYERYRRDARQLVTRLQPAIQLVAGELLKCKTLTGDEVMALVEALPWWKVTR